MAVENLKSAPITNRDSTPKVLNNASVLGGQLIEAVGTKEVSAAASSASTYHFCQVPSNARISQVLIYSDDMGTAGVIDVGIYKSTADGGTVVDQDFFASSLDVNAAALNGVDITHESAVFGYEDAEKPLWEALGLSSDPKITYDVVAYVTTAVVDGGTITLKVRYAI